MRLVILLLLAALPAWAQAPGFRSSAPLTLEGEDALHRVALPFEAYRDARRDLADVRIFDSRGEPVPIAWAGEPQAERQAPASFELPAFPVTRMAPTGVGAGTEVTVRAADGTLVAVRSKGGVKSAAARPVAYLIDASAVKVPIGALVLDWKAGAGTQVVHVRVESSDTLKAWGSVASSPVVKVEAAGRALQQPRIEFAPRKAKYFRMTWDAAGFVLDSVRAEGAPETKTAPRAVRTVPATATGKPDEFQFDLGARLPVEALRIVPAETNSVVSASLFSREDESAEWRQVTAAPFYRLQREGAEAQSPPVEIGRHAARYWMARLAKGSSGGAPALEVHWRAAQLVFVARGAEPYTIAFGKPRETAAALPVSSLIPNYEPRAELRLAQARVGAISSAPPPSRWERFVGEVDARRLTLWAVLLGAVAALGFMAWRLYRQMR
jgi:hypothetical protein